MDAVCQPSHAVNDKAVFQLHEHSDFEHVDQQEKVGTVSEEAMQESKIDIPVGMNCESRGDNVDD